MEKFQKQTIEAYNKSAKLFNNTVANLPNYNKTYDYLISLLHRDDTVLDLACGPGNISNYLIKQKKLNIVGFDLSIEMLKIAKQIIPEGDFKKQSIINFSYEYKVDAIVIGFGLPYLNEKQVSSCLHSCNKVVKPKGIIYVSFMDGNENGFEEFSFYKDKKFYIYYHKHEEIIKKLNNSGFTVMKTWELEYYEENGRVTKDIVIIGEKSNSI
ncbi:MAG: class I SAM-dependent methyltransferase [Spirochaetales bacterium]|nr:class I SAM-dependent methyltransferase [Spirochaetales bacterium]